MRAAAPSARGPDLPRQVREEQLEALSGGQIRSLPANCLVALATVFLISGVAEFGTAWVWFTVLVGINATRFGFTLVSRRGIGTAANLDRLFAVHVAGAAVSGALWAIVPAIMLAVSSPHLPLICLLLSGITAGASAQAGAYAPMGYAFVSPILGTVIVKFLAACEFEYAIVAATTALFAFVVTRSSHRAQETFINSALLKMEATGLAASLRREHAASELAAERLHRLANHDPLTGLVNRAAFAAALEHWLVRARRGDGTFLLLLLDLDHFKSINDTLGHGAGDLVLTEVAKRLTAVFDERHVAGRLGGDEFAILVADHGGPAPERGAQAQRLADDLIGRVSGAFAIGERRVTIGLSVGIALAPEDGVSAEALMAQADLALYAAKDGGRQGARRFDATLLAAATAAQDIEHDLGAALQGQGLEVWFQPQVTLADGAFVGLEALLRWHHPTRGWIAPPAIVAAALRTRRSAALTGFVVDAACEALSHLGDLGCPTARVALNVSPTELSHYPVAELLRDTMARHGIAPQRLEIEITEEAFAADAAGLAALSKLAETGVQIAIDDFGAGNSSIAYLRNLRVDRIKIDRSFVTGMAARGTDQILVQAILGIGASFGITVVAEGVETAEDLAALRRLNCPLAQGYFFGRPMPLPRLATWLAHHRARVAAGLCGPEPDAAAYAPAASEATPMPAVA